MSQLYSRVFLKILESSIAEDWQVRLVFEDLLKLASQDGVVDMTKTAISRRTNVPLAIVERGIAALEAPDLDSRDPEHQGRRIVRLDAHRDWGWYIVNWDKYDSIRSKLEAREYERNRKRKASAKADEANLPSALPSKDKNTDTTSDTDTEETRNLPERSGNFPGKSRSKDVGAGSAPASRGDQVSDSDWLNQLASDATYAGIDVAREHGKMVRWCEVNKKQPTRRRFVAWLNRIELPMKGKTNGHTNDRNIGGGDLWDATAPGDSNDLPDFIQNAPSVDPVPAMEGSLHRVG